MKLVPQAILDDPTIFVPQTVLDSGLLEGRPGRLDRPQPRSTIWEEFKSNIGG